MPARPTGKNEDDVTVKNAESIKERVRDIEKDDKEVNKIVNSANTVKINKISLSLNKEAKSGKRSKRKKF